MTIRNILSATAIAAVMMAGAASATPKIGGGDAEANAGAIGVGIGGAGGNARSNSNAKANGVGIGVGHGGAGGAGGHGGAGGNAQAFGFGGAGGNAHQGQGQLQGQLQGQKQGQDQSQIGINALSNDIGVDVRNRNANLGVNKSSNYNRSENENSNRNYNSSDARAYQAQGQANKQNINIEGDVYEAAEIPVSPAYAPALAAAQGTCGLSSSGGLSLMDVGISLGSGWVEQGCETRLNANLLIGAGEQAAALRYICARDDEMAAALGDKCGGTTAQGSSVVVFDKSTLSYREVPADHIQHGDGERVQVSHDEQKFDSVTYARRGDFAQNR